MTTAKAAGIIPILCVALTACATVKPEPVVRTVVVKVPVAVTCVPANLGDPPAYPDNDAALKAATPEVRYGLIAAGRVLRIPRQEATEAVIKRCREAANGAGT